MQNRAPIRRLVACLAAGLAFGLAGVAGASAQTVEVEPNNPCATSAQDLTALPLPAYVSGSLDTPPGTPDVDFYRFSAPPGSVVTIRHNRAGARPLGDPYLGIFTNGCESILYVNDDTEGTVNSMARVTVPDDGVIVVAASSYHDSGFVGSGGSSGTYVVSVERDLVADSIAGRVVNSRTGAAVTNVYIYLNRCVAGTCDQQVGGTHAEPDGTFRFESGSWMLWGQPLRAGEYQLTLLGYSYEDTPFGPFTIGEGEAISLGDVPIRPLPVVSSFRGRAVDGITGAPLSGTSEPFAHAELLLCANPWYGCHTVRHARPDAQGVFRFEGTEYSPLFGGEYRVRVSANQYEATESATLTAGDGQNVDFGDVRVKSFPVRVELVEACGAIPAEGDHCRFTARFTNGNSSQLSGEGWSIVRGGAIGEPSGFTMFQVGNPRTLSLAPGASVDLGFSFYVPGSVANGASICVTGYAGQKPHNMNSLGAHQLFCLTKGVSGFKLVPEEHKRELGRAHGAGGTRKQ